MVKTHGNLFVQHKIPFSQERQPFQISVHFFLVEVTRQVKNILYLRANSF